MDTWRKKGLSAGQQTSGWIWQWGKREGSGAAFQACPLPHVSSNFLPLAMRAGQRLDSPASRDQINDRDN
jgi:hypothetical protein